MVRIGRGIKQSHACCKFVAINLLQSKSLKSNSPDHTIKNNKAELHILFFFLIHSNLDNNEKIQTFGVKAFRR